MEFFEALFSGLLELGAEFAPRPVRIGCTILLVIVALGLLTLVLWVPR
jgi:hypothetical protein